MTIKNLLHINSSGRKDGSLTREISSALVSELKSNTEQCLINERDLAAGLPFVDEEWINANFTDPAERTEAQKTKLSFSDKLVAELEQADTIVIASPVYNFSIPAVLKAWVDMIARARVTFKYTENGPVGLLQGKKAYLVMASGGVPIGSEGDLATRYLKQVLQFIGITNVEVVDATKVNASEITVAA